MNKINKYTLKQLLKATNLVEITSKKTLEKLDEKVIETLTWVEYHNNLYLKFRNKSEFLNVFTNNKYKTFEKELSMKEKLKHRPMFRFERVETTENNNNKEMIDEYLKNHQVVKSNRKNKSSIDKSDFLKQLGLRFF